MSMEFLVFLIVLVNALAISDTHPKLSDVIYNRPTDWQTNGKYEPLFYQKNILSRTLDVLNKKGKEYLKTNNVRKCLAEKRGLKNKLKCIKGLMFRNDFKRQGYDTNLYYKDDKINRYSNEYDYYDFKDLTKSDLVRRYRNTNFSDDYLDVKDLLRTFNKHGNKKIYVHRVVQPRINRFERFDYDLTDYRRMRNNLIEKKYDTSSSDESETKKQNGGIDKTYTDDSNEFTSEDSMEVKKDPAVFYMQSPSRLYGEDRRRRLPHFFPKRYHWDEDEMKDLNNYWFNGPQGKYGGHYKTPY